MTRQRIRFGVEVDRETDCEIKKLADLERRSKRNFHATLLNRLVRMWKENPERLRELRLVQEEA